MSMIGKRKSKDSLSVTGLYIRNREENGLPLPPTMRRGTKEYIKSAYWQTLKQRTVGNKEFVDCAKNAAYKRYNVELLISKEEFHAWVDENWEKFSNLYDSGLIPSIDRIDKSIGYSIGNMDVIDLRENMSKDRRKRVARTPVDGGTQVEYRCAKDAICDGFCSKAISRAIKVNGSHKGFFWRFI